MTLYPIFESLVVGLTIASAILFLWRRFRGQRTCHSKRGSELVQIGKSQIEK